MLDADIFFPESKNQVIKFQQKYRDFDLTGTFNFVKRLNRPEKERSMLTAKIEVTWDQPGQVDGDKRALKEKRSKSITVLDPKS